MEFGEPLSGLRGKALLKNKRTNDGAEDRLARIEARIEATLPHLATKTDIVGLKWAIGFLGVVILGGFGFLIQLITSL